jgi:flap endonuclease-1
MGIPVIQAKQDGEAQAAYIVNENLAYAVGSQDYDSLLFGTTRMIRNLSQSQTRKVKSRIVHVNLEWLNLPKILEANKLTMDQLIDIGILVGVDFFPGVPGVGPKTALNLIHKHASIEKIIAEDLEIRKNRINYYINLEKVIQIRSIFKNPEVFTDIPKIKWKMPNSDKIREILCEKHNFNRERIEKALERIRKQAKSTQTTLGDFF